MTSETESLPIPTPTHLQFDFAWEDRIRRIRTRAGTGNLRSELPWPVITMSVLQAVDDCYQGKKFINTRHLAEYICDSEKRYVLLSGEYYSVVHSRVGTVLDKKLQWKRYTSKGSRACIYVDGRVKE